MDTQLQRNSANFLANAPSDEAQLSLQSAQTQRRPGRQQGSLIQQVITYFKTDRLVRQPYLYAYRTLRTSPTPEKVRAVASFYQLRGLHLEAVETYLRYGLVGDAVRVLIPAQDLERAGYIFSQYGVPERAAACFAEGQLWLQAGECYELLGDYVRAAECFQKGGASGVAAECLRRAGVFEPPLDASGQQHGEGFQAPVAAPAYSPSSLEIVFGRAHNGEAAEAGAVTELVAPRASSEAAEAPDLLTLMTASNLSEIRANETSSMTQLDLALPSSPLIAQIKSDHTPGGSLEASNTLGGSLEASNTLAQDGGMTDLFELLPEQVPAQELGLAKRDPGAAYEEEQGKFYTPSWMQQRDQGMVELSQDQLQDRPQDQLQDQLSGTQFFKNFSHAERSRLWQMGKVLEFKPGTTVIDYDDEPLGLFTVIDGHVDIHHQDKGLEVVADRIGAQSSFGQFWAVMNMRSRVRITAALPATVHVIARSEVRRLLHEQDSFSAGLRVSFTRGLLEHMQRTMLQPEPKR